MKNNFYLAFKETFRGHGLGYDYLTVNHNDEDYGCLSLFSIDPSAPLRAQLKAALPDKKSLSEAIVVIAVDLARPWAVINGRNGIVGYMYAWFGQIYGRNIHLNIHMYVCKV